MLDWIVLCWTGLGWTGFDLLVCNKACPDCVCFVAFSVHLFALAKPQWFHNDQVIRSESKVGHHKQKTVLLAWTLTSGTLPACSLPQLVQVTASQAASERRRKKAKSGEWRTRKQRGLVGNVSQPECKSLWLLGTAVIC